MPPARPAPGEGARAGVVARHGRAGRTGAVARRGLDTGARAGAAGLGADLYARTKPPRS